MPDLSFLDDLSKEYKIIRDVVVPVSQGNDGNNFEFSAIVVSPYEISLIVCYDWKGQIQNVGQSQWLLNGKRISNPMAFCEAAARNVENLLWENFNKASVATAYVYLPYVSSVDTDNMQLAISPERLKEIISVQLFKKYSEKEVEALFEYFNKFKKSGIANSQKVTKGAKIQNNSKPKQVEAIILDTQQKPVQEPKKKNKKKKKANNKVSVQKATNKKSKQQNVSKNKANKKENINVPTSKAKIEASKDNPKITIGLIKPYVPYSDRKEMVVSTKDNPIKTSSNEKVVKKENFHPVEKQNTKKKIHGLIFFSLFCLAIVVGVFLYRGCETYEIPYPFTNTDLTGVWYSVDASPNNNEGWSECFILNEDGTYVHMSTYKNPETSEEQTDSYAGTYSIDNSIIYFIRSGEGVPCEQWDLNGEKAYYGYGEYSSFFYRNNNGSYYIRKEKE